MSDMRLPIDVDESQVERHFGRDPMTRELMPDSVISGLVDAARTTRQNGQTLQELIEATAADKTTTPAVAALNLRNSGLRLAETAAKRLDAAKARAAEAIAELSAKVARPEPLANVHLASEIRARLAALPEKERKDAIAAALNSDDQTIAAAILTAPPFLSGLSPVDFELRRHQWQARRFPTETARLERLTKATEALERVGNAFIAYAKRATTTPQAELAASMAARSEAARQAVTAAGNAE